MQLKDFYDYKNQLIGDLMTDENIVELITGSQSITQSITDPKSLVYKQVFPYEYIPDTVEEGGTFICCDVDVLGSGVGGVGTPTGANTYLYPVIYIWIFTHKSNMRLSSGGVRVDELASKICERINGSRQYGLGKLELYSSKRFAPIKDYQGKLLTFHTKEFNRFYNPAQTIPSNRKKG